MGAHLGFFLQGAYLCTLPNNAPLVCSVLPGSLGGVEETQMRRLIRHKLTGLFYLQSGDLTPREEDAANFSRIEDAIEFCQSRGFMDVDLIVKSGQAPQPQGLICTMRI